MAESLRVSSLETFAKTGEINADLEFYFKLTNTDEATRQEFRKLLVQRADLKPFLISQFFNSQFGSDILEHLGLYFQTPAHQNGKQAIRAGLVLAAFDPEGLSLLNFLKKLPVNLTVDVAATLETFQALQQVMTATNLVMQNMAAFTAQQSNQAPKVNFAQLPDLRLPGSLEVQEQRWVVKDASRDRQLYVLIVRPKQWRPGKTPVLVVSHGLGAKPEEFLVRARHLASYGFLVALPQHPGSDAQQVQNLMQGLSSHYFLNQEFIDRPRDISFVIDELERRNQTEFEGRLELQSVGVIGHSFGGYSVLAVAGATIDPKFLQQECDRPFSYLDTSLLLQCRALQLPQLPQTFRDPRVKAVFAANPVNYAIFGPQGLGQITIPVFMLGGSDDPATPVVFEQARSFPLVAAPIKYLALAEGQAHINFINLDGGVSHTLDTVKGLDPASSGLLKNYADAMLLAFFETHLVGDRTYQLYLQAAYAEFLSQDQTFKLFMVNEDYSRTLQTALLAIKNRL